MPEFTAEIDIDPSEYLDYCSKWERKRLIEILIEDGDIDPDQADKAKSNGVNKPNINDTKFWDSLDSLAKSRHLLSADEEDYINNLAEKFKYLG